MPKWNTRNAAPPNPESRKLVHVLSQLLGVTNVAQSDETKAIMATGVTGFSDFLSLPTKAIEELTVPDNDPTLPGKPLGALACTKLRIVQAMYHNLSRIKKEAIDIESIDRACYDDYRISQYNQNRPITPWNQTEETADAELSVWKKNARPSRSDYMEFKDDAYWTRYKEHFLTTIQAHGLNHLIKDGYIPVNDDLALLQ